MASLYALDQGTPRAQSEASSSEEEGRKLPEAAFVSGPKHGRWFRRPSKLRGDTGLLPHDIVMLMEEGWFWRPGSNTCSGDSSTSSRSGYHDSAYSFSPSRRSPEVSLRASTGSDPGSAASPDPGGRVSKRDRNRAARLPEGPQPQPDSGGRESTGSSQEHQSVQGKGREENGDGLGTWADRQFRFVQQGRGSSPTHIPGTPVLAPAPPRQPAPASSSSEADEAARADAAEAEADTRAEEAAWRWRFGRRWRVEQEKQLDPDTCDDGDEEDWDQALGYLDACGPGYHLQIARTTSVEDNKCLAQASLHSQGSDLSNLLLDESQREGLLREQAEMGATRSIMSVARKAQDLYVQQQEIEKRVQRRWGDTKMATEPWAGQALPAVKIDLWGSFPFALVRLADRGGSSRLLLRGRNDAALSDTLRALHVEVVGRDGKAGGSVTYEVLGHGTIVWSRERDRRIDVSCGQVENPKNGQGRKGVRSGEDVARLAGALARSSLPLDYRVTVSGVNMR